MFLRNNTMILASVQRSYVLSRLYCVHTMPRITVPHVMAQKIEKVKQKNYEDRRKERPTFKSPVVISCKRAKYNHHKGQTYSNFSPEILASGGWKHYKSKGDSFTIHALRDNPSFTMESDSCLSFSDFNIDPRLIDALQKINVTVPTNVQSLTIPKLLDGHNVLCSAETGSGKTLAFLLPILHKILRQQDVFGHSSQPNQPSAVILTPLRELADQIYEVCTTLCADLPIAASVICGGRGTQKLLRNPPVSKLDLLVSTPGVFSKLLTNRIYSMDRLDHIVFDEADTLFDDSFSKLSLRLIRKMKIQSESLELESSTENVGTQVALVGATVPRDLNNILTDILPLESLTRIDTPHLHHLQPHVPQKFMRLGPSECPEYLLQHLKKNSGTPTLVFCKNSKTAGFVHMFLKDNGLESMLLHAQMTQKVREGRFEEFQKGVVDILVCTDIVSRGLDTIRAQHVINYNFPEFISDYIHRVGRVGRVGSVKKGAVLNFICHKWDVDLLWQIETSARKSSELHNVNANIKRKLTGIIQRKFFQEQNNIP